MSCEGERQISSASSSTESGLERLLSSRSFARSAGLGSRADDVRSAPRTSSRNLVHQQRAAPFKHIAIRRRRFTHRRQLLKQRQRRAVRRIHRLLKAIEPQQLLAQAAAHIHPDLFPGVLRVRVIAVVQPRRQCIHAPGARVEGARAGLHMALAGNHVFQAEHRGMIPVNAVARVRIGHARQLHKEHLRFRELVRQEADQFFSRHARNPHFLAGFPHGSQRGKAVYYRKTGAGPARHSRRGAAAFQEV